VPHRAGRFIPQADAHGIPSAIASKA